MLEELAGVLGGEGGQGLAVQVRGGGAVGGGDSAVSSDAQAATGGPDPEDQCADAAVVPLPRVWASAVRVAGSVGR